MIWISSIRALILSIMLVLIMLMSNLISILAQAVEQDNKIKENNLIRQDVLHTDLSEEPPVYDDEFETDQSNEPILFLSLKNIKYNFSPNDKEMNPMRNKLERCISILMVTIFMFGALPGVTLLAAPVENPYKIEGDVKEITEESPVRDSAKILPADDTFDFTAYNEKIKEYKENLAALHDSAYKKGNIELANIINDRIEELIEIYNVLQYSENENKIVAASNTNIIALADKSDHFHALENEYLSSIDFFNGQLGTNAGVRKFTYPEFDLTAYNERIQEYKQKLVKLRDKAKNNGNNELANIINDRIEEFTEIYNVLQYSENGNDVVAASDTGGSALADKSDHLNTLENMYLSSIDFFNGQLGSSAVMYEFTYPEFDFTAYNERIEEYNQELIALRDRANKNGEIELANIINDRIEEFTEIYNVLQYYENEDTAGVARDTGGNISADKSDHFNTLENMYLSFINSFSDQLSSYPEFDFTAYNDRIEKYKQTLTVLHNSAYLSDDIELANVINDRIAEFDKIYNILNSFEGESDTDEERLADKSDHFNTLENMYLSYIDSLNEQLASSPKYDFKAYNERLEEHRQTLSELRDSAYRNGRSDVVSAIDDKLDELEEAYENLCEFLDEYVEELSENIYYADRADHFNALEELYLSAIEFYNDPDNWDHLDSLDPPITVFAATTPTLSTYSATNITTTSATLRGYTSIPASKTWYYAFEMATVPNPTTVKVYQWGSSASSGNLSLQVTGLLPNTTYYYRPTYYGSGSSGQRYTGGAQFLSFTTMANPTYTISYNANGGSGAPSSQTKTHNVTLTLSSTKPTRSGYTFEGWSTSSTATTATYQPGGSYTANAPATLYAVWSSTPTLRTDEATNITYNSAQLNGYTTVSGGKTWYYGYEYSTNSNMSNATTVSWGSSAISGSLSKSISGLSSSTTYYFRPFYYVSGSSGTRAYGSIRNFKTAAIPTYTISYSANGGSGAPASQTKTYNVTLTLSSTKPTRSGFTFEGWSTSSTAATATYQPGGSYTANAPATLYAVWSSIPTLRTDEASNITATSAQLNGYTTVSGGKTWYYGYEYSTSSTMSNATTVSWGSSLISGSLSMPISGLSSSTTYYFRPFYYVSGSSGTRAYGSIRNFNTAAIPTYTITYNANGGTGAPASQTKTHNVTLTLSNTKPTRSGFTFEGWSTSSTAATATYQSGGSYTANSNATLYAVWSSSPTLRTDAATNITYNSAQLNGYTTVSGGKTWYYGYEYSTNSSMSNATTVSWGSSLISGSLSKPISGLSSSTTYYFRPFYYVSGSSGARAYGSIRNFNTAAIPTYTITYNANGGTGAPASQTKTHNVTLTLSSTKPSRSGYTFEGWSTSSTATTATYQPGGSYTANASATLYAVWSSSPTLRTDAATNITATGAKLNGYTTVSGGRTWVYGYELSTNSNMSNATTVIWGGSITSGGLGMTISVLSPSTTYYFRPFYYLNGSAGEKGYNGATIQSFKTLGVTLTVSITERSFGAEASSATVNVTSNATWSTSSSDQTWLTTSNITQNTRSSNGSFKINAKANTGGQRVATITVTAPGAPPKTIKITQAGNGYVLVQTEDIILGAVNGRTATITINSNSSWLISSSDNWLKIKSVRPTNQTGNGSVVIEADTNLGEERQAIFKVWVNGGAILEIKVTQKTQLESFNYAPSILNSDLAIRCAKYAMLAYQEFENTLSGFKEEKSISTTALPAELHKELNKDGFDYESTFNTARYGDDKPDNVSFTLANKKVSYNGKTRNLVAIIIRGTDTVEWYGNMDITGTYYKKSERNHTSFELAKDVVIEELNEYKKGIDDPLFLVTGHSRGAAAANLLAHDLNNVYGSKNVFAYTFATPNNTLDRVEDQNIFNFCFEDDFVPQVPLENWKYGKHGITYTKNAAEAYLYNTKFREEMNQFASRSYGRGKTHHREKAASNLVEYVYKYWPSTYDYYNKIGPDAYDGGFYTSISLYEYFSTVVARAAIKGADWWDKLNLPISSTTVLFIPIAKFFVSGAVTSNSIADTHIPFTYYAALKHGVFPNISSLSASSPTSTDTIAMGIQNPLNPNQQEMQKLVDFAKQFDNLANLGWDLNDVSTWDGILWTEGVENRVQSIDISYLTLLGKLDLVSFTELRYLKIAGNFINEIDLTDCNSLIYLNCYFNRLESLTVPSAEIINCDFNQLKILDVTGAVNLNELSCFANELTSLNLSRNMKLARLDCSDNNLLDLDLSSNTGIIVLSCGGNYLDVQEGSMLWMQIQDIENGPSIQTFGERPGTLLSYENQKIKENFVLNVHDVSALTQFANQDGNLAKLGWDLSKPETWQGIQWAYANNEYHVQEISIGNLALTGDLNLSGMEQLIRVFCGDNDLKSIDVSGCDRLFGLFCRNAGISNLNIRDCSSLTILDCEDNYLDISDIINYIVIIRTRENAWVGYSKQKLPYDFNISTPGLTFDKTSKMLTLDAIEFSAEGVIPDSVFVEVNKINASNKQTPIASDTITLDASGNGIYSLAASPATISAIDEHVEILVYTDSSCTQIVSQMDVIHIFLES